MNSTYCDRHGNIIDSMSTLNPPHYEYTPDRVIPAPEHDEVPEESEEQDTYHTAVSNTDKQKKLSKKYKKILKKTTKTAAKLNKLLYKKSKLSKKIRANGSLINTHKNAEVSISAIIRKECARSDIFNAQINETFYPSNPDFRSQLQALRIFDGLAWLSHIEIPLDILKKHPEVYVYNLTESDGNPGICDSTVEISPENYVGLILSQQALLGDGEHSREANAPIEYLDAEISLDSLFTISQV